MDDTENACGSLCTQRRATPGGAEAFPAWSVASAGRHRLRGKDTARDWPRGLNQGQRLEKAWSTDELQTLKDLKYEA